MKGFRKSLGLYTIEKLEDTSIDISKEPVEEEPLEPTKLVITDVELGTKVESKVESNVESKVESNVESKVESKVESNVETEEETAEETEEETEDEKEDEKEDEVKPIVETETKPLEDLDEKSESGLDISSLLLDIGKAIIFGVIVYFILQYFTKGRIAVYSSKYENSINEFDVSVTNTSDFSFDTADVDAISPIEMIN